MSDIIYETGEIHEIGQGVLAPKYRQFSHLVLKREDGQLVKLQNVVADDFLVPILTSIGSQCTIAFINKNIVLPKELGSLRVNNVIISVAGPEGYIVGPPVEETALITFFGVVCAATSVLALYGLLVGSTAWAFVGGLLAIVSGLALVGNLRGRSKSNSARSRMINHYEGLGFKPYAAKIYA